MLQQASSRSSLSTNSSGSSSQRRVGMPTLEKLAIVTPLTSPSSRSRHVKRFPARASWQPSPQPQSQSQSQPQHQQHQQPYHYPYHPYAMSYPPPLPPPQSYYHHPQRPSSHHPSPYHYPYPYPYPYAYPQPSHHRPSSRPPSPPHPPSPVTPSYQTDQGVYSPDMAGSFMAEYKGRQYPRYALIGGLGPYGLPCDDEEVERLDGVHWMLRTLLGGALHELNCGADQSAPFFGPVQVVLGESSGGKNKRILDVGTGSGVWAVDMAEMYPEAEVVGVDIAPMQSSQVPDNCSFELADVNEGFQHPDASFDVIHARMFLCAVQNIPAFMKEVARVLRPGGIFLLFEPSPDLPELANNVAAFDAPGLRAWNDALKRARGPVTGSDAIIEALSSCGLVDLEGGSIRIPIGDWNEQPHLKHVGILNHDNIKAERRAYEYLLEVKAGYTPAEIEVLNRAYLADLEKDPLYSSYLAFHVRKAPA